MSLEAVLASAAVSKNSWAQVTADREVSVKILAEESMVLARVTRVEPRDRRIHGFGRGTSTHAARSEVIAMVRWLAEKEHSAALDRLTSSISAIMKFGAESTKPWEPEAPEHTSGTGFCFPTTRSGQSRSKVTRQRATWRLGELPTCAKGETTLPTPSQKRGRYTQASCCLFVLGQASGTLGCRSARFARVQGVERQQGCRATITGTAPASETQAKAGEGDCCAGCRPGFRLAFSHFSLTFLARQSPRPSHFQRAQLAHVALYCLFSTAQARLRRYVCRGLRWVFQLRKRGRALQHLERVVWRHWCISALARCCSRC